MGEAYYSQHQLTSCNLVLSNMYGKHDHFDEARSHALGAILDKVYKAKINNEESVTIWGTGSPIREWLYVEDGVKSLVKATHLAEGNYFFNIGVNKGISIKELAIKIAELLDWGGNFEYDLSRPDGAPEKRVDGSSSLKYLNGNQKRLEDGLENKNNRMVFNDNCNENTFVTTDKVSTIRYLELCGQITTHFHEFNEVF